MINNSIIRPIKGRKKEKGNKFYNFTSGEEKPIFLSKMGLSSQICTNSACVAQRRPLVASWGRDSTLRSHQNAQPTSSVGMPFKRQRAQRSSAPVLLGVLCTVLSDICHSPADCGVTHTLKLCAQTCTGRQHCSHNLLYSMWVSWNSSPRELLTHHLLRDGKPHSSPAIQPVPIKVE